MNPLENVNDSSKCVIKDIIETHRENQALINQGKNAPHYLPGIIFSQLFSDNECILNILQGENDTLALEIVFTKNGEEGLSKYEIMKKHEQFGGKKKYLFVEKLIYVMSLYDNGYIYFSEENNKGLPHFTTITEGSEFFKNEKLNVMIWFISYPSLFQFVKKFYYANIIPTTTLIEFFDNGYKTTEQLRYDEQIELNKKSLEISQSSLIEAQAATSLARKSQRTSIVISSIICGISLLGSYLIASYIPVSVDKKFSNTLENHLQIIESNDSALIRLESEMQDIISIKDSVNKKNNITISK